MTGAAHGWGRAAAALLAVVLGCLSTLPLLGAPAHAADGGAPAQAARSAADQVSDLTVQLAAISPGVATPGAPVRVAVTVTNATAAPVDGVRIAAHLGSADALQTREQLREHAASTDPPASDPVAGATVPGSLPSQQSATVDLTLPGRAIPSSRPYGVLPLTLVGTGAGTDRPASVATFLPYHSRKEYEPLSVAVATPLTLDPDPALLTAGGEDRLAAWTRAIGPDSRVARIAAATSGLPVTWAIDPQLVGADRFGSRAGTGAADNAPTPTPTGSPETEPTAQDDPVAALQRNLRDRLDGDTGDHPVWALPAGDPDLGALAAATSDAAGLDRFVAASSGLASLFGLPGVARVAWPVGAPLQGSYAARIREAFDGAGPTAALTPASAIRTRQEVTPVAPHRDPAGTPLLAYDDELSRLLTSATSGARPVELTQRFLAETLALLAESPGRPRTVLIATPRTFDPDVPTARRLLGTLSGAPWLQAVSTDTALEQARSQGGIAQPTRTATDPLSPGPSPLNAARVARLSSVADHVVGLDSVLSATDSSALVPDAGTLRALVSSRWRAAPEAWQRARTTVEERITTLTTGVSVLPSTVNFFAEHGAVQVTVVNDLDVEVHDVRLVLEPQGRPARLQVVQPPQPLYIRPNSRTTVRVEVEAIAAGLVPVATYLITPAGTRLGSDATVRMRVQPTSGWALLAVGGLVGVVFVAGLYRALRAGRPRVSAADLKEIDLE